jgi:glyoxylase-like metal-dependent hydrolase (beta-lactamase superfamily II)
LEDTCGFATVLWDFRIDDKKVLHFSMTDIAPGIRLIDLNYQGLDNIIATAVVETPAGLLLIDPGPSASLPRLNAELNRLGIAWPDIQGLLLTHIHLDHCGASGSLMQEHPWLKLYVHERGAPHMVDPRRLLESAKQLYGDAMDSLWGPFLPVPADRLITLQGEERLKFDSRVMEVAYTPGHASHHISFLDTQTGIAFCGDVGGLRLAGLTSILPPTPPPDIHLENWETSIARIRQWSPSGLFLTHFGLVDGSPSEHLDRLQTQLTNYANRVKAIIDASMSDADRVKAFVEDVVRELRSENSEEGLEFYLKVVPLDLCYLGLQRYWKKKSITSSQA